MMKYVSHHLPPGRWWLTAWIVTSALWTFVSRLLVTDPTHTPVLSVTAPVGVFDIAVSFTPIDLVLFATCVLLLLLLFYRYAPVLARRLCSVVMSLACLIIAGNLITLALVYPHH